MALSIRVTYTHEIPTTLPPETAGSIVLPSMQTTAELAYAVKKFAGLFWVTEWPGKRGIRFFRKLESFSAEAYRDAQQRFSEMDA